MGAFEVVDYEGLRYLCSRSTGVVQGHICLEAPHVPAVPYLRAALSTLLLDDCFSGARNILLIGLVPAWFRGLFFETFQAGMSL